VTDLTTRNCKNGSKDPPLQRKKLRLHNTAAKCSWETNRMRERARNHACRNGFVSRDELLAAFHDRLAAMIYFCGLSAGRHP
jgi:hypothetical protein